jgi:hypothetical protein
MFEGVRREMRPFLHSKGAACDGRVGERAGARLTDRSAAATP